MKKNILNLVGTALCSTLFLYGCSEDLPSYSELTLDKNEVFMRVEGESTTAQVHIKSGNGNYRLIVADENIVSATLNGNEITLSGLNNGTTTVRVEDWAKCSSVVNVRVKEDFELTLSTTELSMYKGENEIEQVSIISGNDNYEVSSSNEAVATALLNEEGKIVVTAVACGHCEVKVKDADGLEQIIAVSVYDQHLVIQENWADLTYLINQSTEIAILSGNGEYQVSSENEAVASVTLEDNIIKVTGVTKGETVITVTDRMGLTVQFTVKISAGFELAETQIEQLLIENDPVEIAIVDGSGDYTIEPNAYVTVTLSEDKTKFLLDGIDKQLALSQTVKLTDNVFGTVQEITIGEINYAFETYGNARWFIEGQLNIIPITTLDIQDGKVHFKVGDGRTIFGNTIFRSGYSFSFQGGPEPGNKTDGLLYHINSSGKEENPITITDVEVVKRELDEGRGENGKYWIRFKEAGKEEWSYIITWS